MTKINVYLNSKELSITCLLNNYVNFAGKIRNDFNIDMIYFFYLGDSSRILGNVQCNQEDNKIWNIRKNEVKKALGECGPSCWGGAQCTTECMLKKTELSTKCANCFGNFAGCGKSNCSWSCMFGTTTSSCINCVKKYCVDGFKRCSGLSSPM